jgi:hypothetical protein
MIAELKCPEVRVMLVAGHTQKGIVRIANASVSSPNHLAELIKVNGQVGIPDAVEDLGDIGHHHPQAPRALCSEQKVRATAKVIQQSAYHAAGRMTDAPLQLQAPQRQKLLQQLVVHPYFVSLSQRNLEATVPAARVWPDDLSDHLPQPFIACFHPLLGTSARFVGLLVDARQPTHRIDAHPPEGYRRAGMLDQRPSGGA